MCEILNGVGIYFIIISLLKVSLCLFREGQHTLKLTSVLLRVQLALRNHFPLFASS